MTPAGRLQASIELLAAVLSDPRPADGVVSAFLRARRYMGAKDRRDVTERVWSILRSRERLDWHLQKFGLDPVQPRAFVLAHGVVCDGLTPSTLATLCTGERFAPAPLKPREEDWLKALAGQALEHPDMPRAVRLECPSWLLPRLETALAHQGGPGDGQLDGTSDGTSEEPDQAKDPDAEIAALTLGMAPVDLRANLLKATREQTTNLLTKEGISAEPGPLSPWALRLAERPHLAETKAFKEGFVEVQDASSQVAALLCGVGPGLSVLDYCAGAGGKTLALAAAMANKGAVWATDTDQGRLDRAKTRISRAGAHNVNRRLLGDAGTIKWLKRNRKRFDRVLVDAPCSGIGTWRRNPDAKRRLSPEDLHELSALQASLLEKAARQVKPGGGRLIYATCSVLREENEGVLEPFLAANPDFAPLPVASIWSEVGGVGPAPTVDSSPYLRLTPARHGTDGFFIGILERAAAPQAAALEATSAPADPAADGAGSP